MRTPILIALAAALVLAGCMSGDETPTDPAVTPAALDEGNSTAAPEALPEGAVLNENGTVDHVMTPTALSYAGKTDTGGCLEVEGQGQCHFTNGANTLYMLSPDAMHLTANVTWTPQNPAKSDLTVMIVPIVDGEPQWGEAANHTLSGPSPLVIDWHLGEFMGKEFGLGVTSAEFQTVGPAFILREISQDFTVEGTVWDMVMQH